MSRETGQTVTEGNPMLGRHRKAHGVTWTWQCCSRGEAMGFHEHHLIHTSQHPRMRACAHCPGHRSENKNPESHSQQAGGPGRSEWVVPRSSSGRYQPAVHRLSL